MRYLLVLLMVCSLCFFSLGCEKKPADKPADDAAPAADDDGAAGDDDAAAGDDDAAAGDDAGDPAAPPPGE